VPEYDAFGREIGEDTLAGWRSGASPQPVDAPEHEAERATPTPSPRPAAATAGGVAADAPLGPATAGGVTAGDPLGAATTGGVTAGDPLGTPTARGVTIGDLLGTPTGAPPSHSSAGLPRRRRRRRSGVRWILALVVLFVAVRFVIGVTGEVRDAIRDIDLPAVTIPTPEAPAVAPTGLGAGSLLRPAAFERALADLRGREIGRIQSLRLAPERIDVSLLTRRGTLVSAQIPAGGKLRRFGESGAGFGGLETIPYARIETGAPRRLVRAAAERLGRPATRINYLVATYTSGEMTWGAYFKGGAIFLADARGRITRRIS